MNVPRLNSYVSKIAFAATAVVLPVALVLLLPILIPAIAISEAWETRRLARSRCVTCHNRIGLAEIRRAKRDGIAKAWAAVGTTPAIWHRRRIVVVWQVICPTCGHAYVYGPDKALGLASTARPSDGLPNN
jgi:hypothetical protein